jgi:hypothetical protein
MRILVFLLLAAPVVCADSPAAAGDAPKIELEAAVAKAKRHASAKKIELSRQYLQAAEFDPAGAAPGATGRCWSLRWQVPRAKGGTTFFTVCEDGRIEHTFGE